MDTRFSLHNLHLDDLAIFQNSDPQLGRLKKQAYIYESNLINEFPLNTPGIYTLGGGRQIGKTTLLKQWMLKLLKTDNVAPGNIAYLSGEIIDDHHALLHLLHAQLNIMHKDQQGKFLYLIIDEITYIKDWDKAIKYAADTNYFENVILILTGSDLLLMNQAKMTFPGRRGLADIVDFHLYPLSFKEVLQLKSKTNLLTDPEMFDLLHGEFMNYLEHGGFLTAINDLAANGKISKATLQTYSEWIRGDILKKGKQENYLKELILAITKKQGSQITWHSFAQELSIDSHKTVADYMELLNSMDAVYIQFALLEDKLIAAPKKAKKVMFADPFIFHSMNAWINPTAAPYDQIKKSVSNPELVGILVESLVTTTIRRKYPTYYIKAEGEVDLAYINNKRFWPIEIKWTNQIRKNDLKQIMKYSNGQIWTKTQQENKIEHIKMYYLPLALAMFQ